MFDDDRANNEPGILDRAPRVRGEVLVIRFGQLIPGNAGTELDPAIVCIELC